MSAFFYIAFDTREMHPQLLATRVDLKQEVIRDDGRQLPINLCDHPLYRQLEQYVLANPSKKRK